MHLMVLLSATNQLTIQCFLLAKQQKEAFLKYRMMILAIWIWDFHRKLMPVYNAYIT